MPLNNPFKKRSQIVGFIAFVVFLVFLSFRFVNDARQFGSFASTATRGGCIIVIQLPAQEGYDKQILVYDDNPMMHPLLATRTRPLGSITLARDVWQALDNTRKQWCDSTPQFTPIAAGENFYRIGFRCVDGFRMYPKEVRVPLEELPLPFHTLLQQLGSSPQPPK